ncbi:probable indole-3-pyruvate monooxygenase YUCCA10 [Tanacetum coccineum]
MSGVKKASGDKEAGDTMGDKRDGNNLGDKPSFANALHEESSKKKVHARFENTLYVYFLRNKVAFSVVERYLLNSWKKYGITRVMGDKHGFIFIQFSCMTGLEGVFEHGHRLIRNVSFILRKWTPSAMLIKEELTFTTDDLSAISTRLGTPIMVDRALKNTMVISIPNLIGNGVTMHTTKCPKRVMADLRKQGGTSNDGFQTVQMKDSRDPLSSKKRDDNEKPMDDLVDDTRKKMEAPPKKTDDMKFDDTGQAVEEVEHENAYSEIG